MNMSITMRLGVLLGAMLAFAGLWGAGVASAATWHQGGIELEEATRYKSTVGTAYFEASSPTNGTREYTLGCAMQTKGLVGPGSQGKITGATDSHGFTKMECSLAQSGIETCAPPETVEAVDLPWTTELVSVGSEVRNVIKAGSGGAPGWKITCYQGETQLTEKCPFGGYSLFSKNGLEGAELLYQPAFAKGEKCVSSNGFFQDNTLKLTYREVTQGFTVS